jgi:hypothetical protein
MYHLSFPHCPPLETLLFFVVISSHRVFLIGDCKGVE